MLSGVRFVPREQLQERRSRRSKGDDDDDEASRRRRTRRQEGDGSSDDSLSSDDNEVGKASQSRRRSHTTKKKRKKKSRHDSEEEDSATSSSSEEAMNGGDGGDQTIATAERSRREAGLEWMINSARSREAVAIHDEAPHVSKGPENAVKVNPRELNPYLKDNGGGYPDETSVSRNQLHPSSLVGDGGASWRLKALKRAKEQAAREGKKLDEIVEERWGSLAQLAVSVGSHRAAPARAHLHAIKDRKKVPADSSVHESPSEKGEDAEKSRSGKIYCLDDVSSHQAEMRKPRSYSWRKEKNQESSENKSLISEAISGSNKFKNDGSFIGMFSRNKDVTSSSTSLNVKNTDDKGATEINAPEMESFLDKGLDPNQLAAEAFRLRLKGKHEEADLLLKKVEGMKRMRNNNTKIINPQSEGRHVGVKLTRKRNEEDADLYLAQRIAKNKQFNISKQADDEYDFDESAPRKKNNKKHENVHEEKNRMTNRLLTQEQRCQFCFENSTRPKHLVVAIAQFSYMALPPWQPVVQGHCCILPMQHESSTRSIDDNVWEELRNFKKCLIMMFDKQDKDVIFLETVIGLAKQQRHCLVECVPLPRDIAKEAPLYFKKAIDEAEDEWSQHNSKKLIRTSREKGLRRCIPKDFPYFHVEFGLDEGFVHVIDDEGNFKNCLGLDVIRGMLGLPEEDMYRRRRHEPVDKQRLAVVNFAKEWEPFDWTKQLS